MNGWKIAVGVFVGLFVLGGIVTAIEGPVEEPIKQEKAVEKAEETVEEIEDYTVEPREERLPVSEVYDRVELGMTESEVGDIAGSPEITSQTKDEMLGTVLQLIYSDGHSLDNVTIMLDDGKVAMVVLGEFDGDKIDVKSKM